MEFIARPLARLSPLEVHQLYKLRVDVFVHEQQTPYAEIDDEDAEETTIQVLAVVDKQVVGTARVYPSLIDGRDVIQFGRFAVAPAHRGTGLAGKLLSAALNAGLQRYPGRPVYLTAQKSLERYYALRGFTPVGEVYDDTGVPHQPMLWNAYSESESAAETP